MIDKEMIMPTDNNSEYDQLLLNVGETLEQGRQTAVAAVNTAMVQTYWEIGSIEEIENEQGTGKSC